MSRHSTPRRCGTRELCVWMGFDKMPQKICKSCQQCRQLLLNTANERNKYIKAKEYCNKNWLCYPSEAAENCFHNIQNVTKSFLKNNVPKKILKRVLSYFVMYW